SVGDGNAKAEAGEEQAGEPANGKQADEAQGVDHGRVPGDGTFIKRRSPIEHFYRRGDGDQIAEEGKGQGRISGFAGDKHVMGPNEEADDGNGDTGSGDEGVAKNGLARKRGDDFA